MLTSFYRRWVLACTMGELVGIGVATGAALVFSALVGEPESLVPKLAALTVFAMVGDIEGGALAGLQWRVLRERLPQLPMRSWIGVTVTIAVSGWIVGMTPSLFFSSDTAAPAWAVAMSAIFLGASLPDTGSPAQIIAVTGALGGVLGGLSLGAVTGLVARTLQPDPAARGARE